MKNEGTSRRVVDREIINIRLLTWTVGILAALTFKNTPIISEVVSSSESLIESLLRLMIREDATTSSKTYVAIVFLSHFSLSNSSHSCLYTKTITTPIFCRYAIGCIYNLSTNTEVQADLMRLKAVDTFMDLCEGESNTVVSGLAVKSLRLLASNKTYRSQMSDDLVPRLIQICNTSTSRGILCEATLTLASLVTNPDTLQLAAKQGILHALQRTQIVLAVDTPEWLPQIIRKVETVLATWRRRVDVLLSWQIRCQDPLLEMRHLINDIDPRTKLWNTFEMLVCPELTTVSTLQRRRYHQVSNDSRMFLHVSLYVFRPCFVSRARKHYNAYTHTYVHIIDTVRSNPNVRSVVQHKLRTRSRNSYSPLQVMLPPIRLCCGYRVQVLKSPEHCNFPMVPCRLMILSCGHCIVRPREMCFLFSSLIRVTPVLG